MPQTLYRPTFLPRLVAKLGPALLLPVALSACASEMSDDSASDKLAIDSDYLRLYTGSLSCTGPVAGLHRGQRISQQSSPSYEPSLSLSFSSSSKKPFDGQSVNVNLTSSFVLSDSFGPWGQPAGTTSSASFRVRVTEFGSAFGGTPSVTLVPADNAHGIRQVILTGSEASKRTTVSVRGHTGRLAIIGCDDSRVIRVGPEEEPAPAAGRVADAPSSTVSF